MSGQFDDGEIYERLMGRWSRVVGKSFLAWLDVPKGKQWLDAGCGNGAFTEELIAYAAPSAVMAVDPSEGQIDYARRRAGTKMAQFQVGDAQALPFADNTFDAAVMALVIAFLPRPEKAVAGLARVVKSGGCVATYMWDIPHGMPTTPLYPAFQSMGIERPLPPNPGTSKQETMLALWRNTGMQSIETRVFTLPIVFPNFDEFWNWISLPSGPQGKFIADMSAGDRNKLRECARQTAPIQADGGVAYEAYANAIKGSVPQ
jgi:SAM-dependent methyltransferase